MSGKEGRHFADAGLGGISAVVATLPVGYTLGEYRVEDGIQYQLKYNAGSSVIRPGYAASPIPVFGGPHSVTVSTVSKTYCNFGAVVVHHQTVPTNYFFWGVRKGYLTSGVVADAATAITGAALYLGVDGQFNTTAGSQATGNIPIAIALVGPTAGTIAVRQSAVLIQFE